ncbi:SDR family NAD(P)-dependent oxidoreductase [Psychrobacillus glaciei]|uniref:SDR family NAD(P)-dependent oxidoreductase n=1 Tax=Psychrobacillus glaciei TaxID=2283160 RepID=A0A5J6SVE1_9BACI|nr:SDR family NAD(P)-dependent oxidoreductase [Psychrobacillus glaciei]QFG01055.1 SDR family NAD(P)-dependent oxidoreductase [Psychrobacillus glaciei]
MKTYIITGTTSGIGLELVNQLLEAGHTVYGIARKENDIDHPQYHHVLLDLTETSKLADTVKEIIKEVSPEASSYTLINNAGTIDPIGMVGEIDGELIAKSIAVNLTAPMVLTGAFIHALAAIDMPKKVVQISSGAGRNALDGWSSYCAGKAGLDRFTEAAQLEESNKRNGVRLVSIAPGIIDTSMQQTIRQSSTSAFPSVERFKEYKASGQLSNAKDVAKKLIGFIESEQFYKVDVLTDLRNL